MNSLIKRVQETIDKFGMLEAGERVLVAVSGGPDSVFLLQALKELSPPYDLRLHIAHLDHQLRGKESREDARFVEALACRSGVPATIERFNLPGYLEGRGVSVEEGGRRVRYEFLNRVADETGSDKIALGHTATDQAETLLLRLMRGAGTLGLSSIPPKRDRIFRPLIEITKDEILDHLRSEQTPYRVDATNLTPCCQRNVVRTEIMPQLAKLNPRVVDTLRRTAEILREEESLLTKEVSRVLPRVVKRKKGDRVALDLDSLLNYNIPVRRRIVREAIREVKGDLLRISFQCVDSILQLAESGRTGARASLPSIVAERGYGELVLWTGGIPEVREFEKELDVPGITPVNFGTRFRCELIAPSALSGDLDFENKVYFDFDSLIPPLVVRNRRRGDRFTPFGMDSGAKKVKDLFIQEKVPRGERDLIPILVDGEGILWVVGFRRSDRAKVGPSTRNVLLVEKME